MKMRMFIGLCAALAFAAGSTTVHALKIVDSASQDPAADGRVSNTYAKETLLSTETTPASDESDTAKYYDIAEEGLFLSAPADITANAGDTYVVSYTLDGMVFQAALANDDLHGSTGGDGFSIAAGGAIGDKSVVFRLGTGSSVTMTTTNLALEAKYAISAAGSGSVTRTVTNQSIAGLNLPGISGTMTHTGSGVIKLGSGLKETAVAMNETATVEHSFRSFDGAAIANVGSLEVTFNAEARQARHVDGNVVSALTQVINAALTGEVPNSTVSIMGDFSFATMAFLHGDVDCSPEGTDTTPLAGETDILTREGTGDDIMVTGAAKQNVTAFESPAHLCIMVDTSEDGMRIPDTAAYTAMGDYAKIENGAFDPAQTEQKLGAITRDGTTVRLPYLTTNAKFAQRLYIVNRGGEAAYEMDFQEDDTAGAMASGTLEANSRTMISVGETATEDALVTIGDGGSTSGSLIIEAQPAMIDVATVQINRELGTTDTVVYK